MASRTTEHEPLVVPITGAFNPMLKVPHPTWRGLRRSVLSPAGWEFDTLSRKLDHAGFDVAEPIVLERYGIQNLFDMSGQVWDQIQRRRRKFGFDRQVIALGHSQGGVVGAHLYMHDTDTFAGAVTVGSPHAIEDPVHESFFRRVRFAAYPLGWLKFIDVDGYMESHDSFKNKTYTAAAERVEEIQGSLFLIGSIVDGVVPAHSAHHPIPGAIQVRLGEGEYAHLRPNHLTILTGNQSADVAVGNVVAIAERASNPTSTLAA